MAYKFTCSSCNSEITSNYLKPGEEAFCFKCGSRTKVPLDAEEVAFVPDLNKISQSKGHTVVEAPVLGKFSGVKAWNPRWFEGMSVPFTFLPSGILLAMNFERFGQPERKLPALVAVIVGFLVLAACFLFIDVIPEYAAIAVNYGFGLYFYHSQKRLFGDFINQGGSRARITVPLGVSVVASILIVIVGLRLESFVKEHAQLLQDSEYSEETRELYSEYVRWKRLREAKEYDSALEIARNIYAADKLEATLSSYVMATAFWDVHEMDSAVKVLDVYLENHASDSGNYWYREQIIAHAEYDSGNYARALEHLTPYIVNNADRGLAWEFRARVIKRLELQKSDPIRCALTLDYVLDALEEADCPDSTQRYRDAILHQIIDPDRPRERAELLKALCAEYPDYNVSIIGQAYELANIGFQDSALFIIDRYLERYGHDTYMRSHRARLVAKIQAAGL